MTTTTPQVPRHANDQPAQTPPNKSHNVATAAFFVIGCAVLICCALAITHLDEWADDYGQVPVFVAFFIVMSLAGRWFWAGADAAITWLKKRHHPGRPYSSSA